MTDKKSYQRLAFNVIRDALGFYLGIPKFLSENTDREAAKSYLLSLKLKEGEIATDKLLMEIDEKIDCKIRDLTEDYEHCKLLLFADNIWYQVLNLTPEVFGKYVDNLSESDKDELAIVPRWSTQDWDLGRPHISDSFVI